VSSDDLGKRHGEESVSLVCHAVTATGGDLGVVM
jgi:hypothetical protein